MAREFWEMFLPENIVVKSARWDGKSGAAEIHFSYPEELTRIFTAKFVRGGPHSTSEWHLEEIL
jgi:hypothetical protein